MKLPNDLAFITEDDTQGSAGENTCRSNPGYSPLRRTACLVYLHVRTTEEIST